MAVNIAALASKKSPLKFEFEGETVNANFYPHKLTPSFRAQLNRADSEGSADEQAHGSAVRMVAELIAPDWDVMAGEEPFLPTAERDWYETLTLAPQSLISAIVKAISDEVGKRMTAETDS